MPRPKLDNYAWVRTVICVREQLQSLLALRRAAARGDQLEVAREVAAHPLLDADAAISLARVGVDWPAVDQNLSVAESALCAACSGGYEALALTLCGRVRKRKDVLCSCSSWCARLEALWAATRADLSAVVAALCADLPRAGAAYLRTAGHRFFPTASDEILKSFLPWARDELLESAYGLAAKSGDKSLLVWLHGGARQPAVPPFHHSQTRLGALRGGVRRMLRCVVACYQRDFAIAYCHPSIRDMCKAAVQSGRRAALHAVAKIVQMECCDNAQIELARGAYEACSLRLLMHATHDLSPRLFAMTLDDAFWHDTFCYGLPGELRDASTESVHDAVALVEYVLMRSNIPVNGPKLPLQPVNVRLAAAPLLAQGVHRRVCGSKPPPQPYSE